jgi:nucleoid-associated protein YgaU
MNQKRPSDTKVTDGELYTVQKGDCLWTIAQQLYGDGSRCLELARLNNLNVNSVLQVGDQLKY